MHEPVLFVQHAFTHETHKQMAAMQKVVQKKNIESLQTFM